MERVFGAVEHRVLDVYGRSLWFFLRNRWISAVTWVVCLAGTAYLFYVVPKAFLPVGDSSFIRGVMVAQEGTSPDQMHAYQTQAEKIMQANPAVRSTFTMSGNASFLGSNQAFLIAFLKDPNGAAADRSGGRTVDGRNRRHHSRRRGLPATESGAGNQHRRNRQCAGPICLSPFPASIPTRCTKPPAR